MKKLYNFIVEKWYLVFIFSLVFNCSTFLISDDIENLDDFFVVLFIVDILILLILLVLFGYHLYIKKWLKAILIFLSSIAHSFISYWVLIGLIVITLAKSCEDRYDEKVKINLNKNDSICPVMKDSLLSDEYEKYLDIGIIEDSVYGMHNSVKERFDMPLCVGVYKLEDGRILTVEKEGLIASIGRNANDDAETLLDWTDGTGERDYQKLISKAQKADGKKQIKLYEEVAEEREDLINMLEYYVKDKDNYEKLVEAMEEFNEDAAEAMPSYKEYKKIMKPMLKTKTSN